MDGNKEPREEFVPDVQDQVTIEHEEDSGLLYNVSDRVPVHIALLGALQQTLIALSSQLAVSSFVVDVVCASDFPDIRRDLLSSTLLMNGVTTLLMVTIGARLPLFQGAASEYIVPLLAMKMVDTDFCTLPQESDKNHFLNASMEMDDAVSSFPVNTTELHVTEEKRAIVLAKLCELQGCLILVGIIHSLVGLTGIGGLLLKFIGPITIVPAILLMGVYLAKATAKFARAHWGIAAITTVTALVMSLYLSRRKMPCPVWSKEKGFHIFWYPLHQIFSVASRDVLLWTALMYIVFGLVGKVSAVFITIPLLVLGGAMIVMYGMLNGIILSNLQVISLSSTRNLAILGTSLLLGLLIPYWLEVYPEDLKLGNAYNDNILKTLLSNPILCGGVTACFLDNTVPGTARERGITAWHEPEKCGQTIKFSEGLEVYAPPLPARWLSWRVMKYLPFCQYKPLEDNGRDQTGDTV